MSEHADHFLSRLDRTSAAETEFALALYRDPELLRSIIELVRPDPAKERVAIALDDADGPHVIVTRDARFVTCLGRGMTAYDAARVSRADLEQCGMTVVRLRALMSRATEVTHDRAGMRAAFVALYADGDRLRREDFEVILKLQPLMLPDLLQSFGVHFDRIQATLRDLSRRDRFRGDEHPRLRATWQGVWAAAHYMTLLASESLALSYRYAASPLHDVEHCFANLASTGIRLGVVPGVLRGAWAAGRMAPVCIDAIEATARDEQMTILRVGAVWALVAAGARHPSLTERVSRTLEELGRVPSRYVSALAPAALKAMRECLDGGAAWEREAVDLLRAGTFEPWTRERWPAFDDDAVVAWHGSLELGVHHADAMPLLGLLVPWFASREGAMFCQPDAVVRRVQERWDVGASEQLLASYRQMWLPREPRHAAPAPGRNDPCACGSGKKFKRCCG